MRALADRPRCVDRIKPFMWNGNAKIVTGIRRCGKSSVLKLVSESIEGDCNAVFINMELAENHDIRGWRDLLSRIDGSIDPSRRNALFIDEVQNVDGWELAIRDVLARGACDVYITGSNSNLLSSEYATHLGGRFNEIRMLPLSLSECADFQREFGGEEATLERFLRIGGFPALWRHPMGAEASIQTVSDLVEVSIAGDIIRRYDVRNAPLLRDLLRCALSYIGKYVSANNMYNALKSSGAKVSPDTVYEYLGHLESANILIRANAFDVRGKRVLTSKYKYYASDLGIKHALLGYRPEDSPGHMENAIFTELLGRGYRVHVGECGGREIDFVAERGDERVYVQACLSMASEETSERELGSLEAIGDSFPKYVVLMDPGAHAGVTEKGVRCVSLSRFLSSEL
ncbi:MAG: ATP-binding protein [Candidatus Methanoplasma sp.]|nr:ATP-binding protein [Candidatus Methanoplasma sp.]